MTEGRKSRRSGGRLITALAAVLMMTVLAGTAAAQSTSGSPTGSASGSGGETTFTYADVAEPSGINPMVGYLSTDYIFWAMNYDIFDQLQDVRLHPGLRPLDHDERRLQR